MSQTSRPGSLTQLLSHTAWARRLARALVSSSDGDDLQQDAWLRALEHPSPVRQPRAWLATVLRHLGRNRFRDDERRRAREAAVADAEPQGTPEQSLARLEIQRQLAERLAALDEPFRTTLLLRYFDGLSSAQIARRLDLPAGTVRWRLKTALERLRADLDSQRPHWRRDWALVLAPPGALAPAAAGGASGAGAGPATLAASSAGMATLPMLLISLLALTGVGAAAGWHLLLKSVGADLPEPAALHAVVAATGGFAPPGTAAARAASGRSPGPALAGQAAAAPATTVVAAAEPSTSAPAVPFEQLPPLLLQAFVAAEDRRFFQHHGTDLHAMARAALANVEAGRIAQGGSTITQQLAKVSLPPDRTVVRKLQQVALAHELEQRYSKPEILTLYLDRIFLGHGAFGVSAAARRYFDKAVPDLDLGDCALLAGVVHAPARLSPITHPDAARTRRNQVLDAMAEIGAITPDVARAWAEKPLAVTPR
jgi:RNA polymerase sigma factor (sigma-70 family)